MEKGKPINLNRNVLTDMNDNLTKMNKTLEQILALLEAKPQLTEEQLRTILYGKRMIGVRY